MDLKLKDKVAIVGGASKGMGRAIAAGLLVEGCKVAIIARGQETLEKTAKELDPQSTGKVFPIAFDLSHVREIPELVKKVHQKFGAVHILINNAGGPKPGKLDDTTAEDWEKTLDQNLKSAIVMTRSVIPLMKAQKYGRIINITSWYVKEPSPTMVLSNTARAAVVAFSKTVSHDVAKYNITMNTLCPGPIFTDRMKYLIEERSKKESKSSEEIKNEIQAMVPMGRMGTPAEFAAMAIFLASECASFVTGTTIPVDGGITKSLM